MRWFKHISNSHTDEIMAELMEEFGAEGYGVWWLILEKIALLMDESDRTSARFSVKVWASFVKVSPRKLQNIVEFLEKNKRIITHLEDKYLTIDCPNLLKYRDEWTERQSKKTSKTLDKLMSDTGKTPVQESDTESDTDIKEDDDEQGLVDKYRKLLIDRLFYLNHLINGKTLEMFQAWIRDGITVEEAKQAMDRGDAQLGKTPSMPSYYRNIPYQIRDEFRNAKTKGVGNGNNKFSHQKESSVRRVQKRLAELAAENDNIDVNTH